MENYRRAKKQIEVSVGESVRIIRELQELSQNELARRTGIPQSTISAIENNRVQLGVERAKVLAQALQCHPVGRSNRTQPLERRAVPAPALPRHSQRSAWTGFSRAARRPVYATAPSAIAKASAPQRK